MPKDGEIKSGIGASSKRREDVRFLTGNGNYTDDINIRGQAYVFFLRSDVAHGTLNSVDTSAAAAMPGVVQIFTGADFEAVGGIPVVGKLRTNTGNRCRNQNIRFWPMAKCATLVNPLRPLSPTA